MYFRVYITPVRGGNSCECNGFPGKTVNSSRTEQSCNCASVPFWAWQQYSESWRNASMRLFSRKKSFRIFKLIHYFGLGLTKSYKESVDWFRSGVWKVFTFFKTKFQSHILAKCNFSPSSKFFSLYFSWL